MTMPAPLTKEFEVFKAKHAEWLQSHKGQYVLIKGTDVIDFFPTYEAALRDAVSRFGNESVLIQEITDEKRVNYIASWLIAS